MPFDNYTGGSRGVVPYQENQKMMLPTVNVNVFESRGFLRLPRWLSRSGRRSRFSVVFYPLLPPGGASLRVELIPHLKRDADAPKLIEAVNALQGNGGVWAVSINFSTKIHDKALTARSGLRRIIQARLSYLLDAGFQRSVFVLEQDRVGGRWHLHGVVVADQGQRRELETALRRVAGRAPTSSANRHLVHIQPPDQLKSFKGKSGLEGWALYMAKRLSASSKALGTGSPMFTTHTVKSMSAVNKPPGTGKRPSSPADEAHLDNPDWGRF